MTRKNYLVSTIVLFAFLFLISRNKPQASSPITLPTPTPTPAYACRRVRNNSLVDGCGQQCNPTSPSSQTGCPQGLLCQPVSCPPFQTCPLSQTGRCVNPDCTACETCSCYPVDWRGNECRTIDKTGRDNIPWEGPDVHEYASEFECITRCYKDYPGRMCRSRYGGERKYCIASLCSIDGIGVHSAETLSDPKHASYIALHKENSCPVLDYEACIDGYECEKIIENNRLTGVKLTKRSDYATHTVGYVIGVNCPCQNHVQNFYGVPQFEGLFCEDHFSGYVQRVKKDQFFLCYFYTQRCDGPFG